MKKTYTVKQIAQALGFSTNTVYKYLVEGKIKATRLGREGRFRIPESEVVRLLGLKGEGQQIAPQIEPQEETVSVAPSLELPPAIQSKGEELLRNITVPSLFDWFVATLSIFLGLSYFLFPASIGYELVSFNGYIIAAKLALIVLGSALLVTDVLRPAKGFHQTVHVLLALVFGILALIFFQIGHYPKVVGYGALSFLLVLTVFTKLSDKARFVLLVNLLAVFGGVVFTVSPDSFVFAPISDWISDNQPLFALSWYLLTATVVSFSIWGFYRGGPFLYIASFIFGTGALLYALFAFQEGFWEDVAYNIVLASFILLSPFWDKFTGFAHTSRKQLVEGLAWFMAVLLIGFSLVFYLQHSFKAFVFSENKKSVAAAVTLVEDEVQKSQKEVLVLSNGQLLALLEEKQKNQDGLADFLRNFYVNSTTLRRVFVVDQTGAGIAIYPDDPEFAALNFSDREYFKRAKETKNLAISDVVAPRVAGTPAAIVIAVPILDKDGEFLGVLGGSLDFVKLGEKLQKLAFGEGAYFALADREKKLIVYPDKELLLKPVANGSPLALAVEGKSGQTEQYNAGGKLTLQTYAPVKTLGWGIVVKQPTSELFRHQNTVSFVIFLVTVISGVGSLLAIVYLRRK